MNLSDMTRQQLVELIQQASAELAQRMNEPSIERIEHVEPVIVMREPPGGDKDFVLAIKGVMLKGGYIKAAERERVAEIAAEYPEWVTRQGVPTSSSAGEWRRAGEYRRMGRAKER